MNKIIFSYLAICLLSFSLLAQTTTQPATQQAATHPAPSKEAMALLKRLEAAGKTIQSIQADFRYETNEVVQQAKTIKFGSLAFYNTDVPAFHVHFKRGILPGGRADMKQKKFIFNERWFAEVDLHARIFKTSELYREGDKQNPFDFSKGLFPLPFGQKAEKISNLFHVEVLEAKEGEINFELSAKDKKAQRFDFTNASFILDEKTLAPKLITTIKTKVFTDRKGKTRERVLKTTEIKFIAGKTLLNALEKQELKMLFNTQPTEAHKGWKIYKKALPPTTPQPKSIDEKPAG